MDRTLQDIETELKKLGSFAIAFSGGVDSSFLLAIAKRVVPEKLIAITVASQFVPEKEIKDAKRIAKALGVEHICVDVDILEYPDVLSNPENRCYHCKKHIFGLIKDIAGKHGIYTLLHAVNLDDLGDYRPGLEAAAELGFLSPLVDKEFTKKDIRMLSKKLGLETWDKPSQSCLATRIPYDVEIDGNTLQMIEASEIILHDLGYEQVRVRCHGKSARIEVEAHKISSLFEESTRSEISRRFTEIGFRHISIDIDGYRSGNMNQGITGQS